MSTSSPPSFDNQLKLALRHFHKPDRLAAESSLATAYFLSSVIQRHERPASWPELLQRELLAAADALWGGEPPRRREEIESRWQETLQQPGSNRYHYLILELRYFNRFYHPRSLQQIWQEFLGQSRAEFYRDVNAATDALGVVLLERLRPGVRPDAPPTLDRLVGREPLVAESLQILEARQRLALNGPAGSGKTSVGAAIAHRWPNANVFWFTVRPGLTDGLHHLLHALAYFFHAHGVSRLWRMLAANAGQIDDEGLAVSLMRADCGDLDRPLLCFDEVDGWPDVAHPVWQALAELDAHAAILLIGQRVPAGADAHQTVGGLGRFDTQALLRQAGITISDEDAALLHRQTDGNPRLLWIAATLLQRGHSLQELLAHATIFQDYLAQLRQRLTPDERHLFESLAVFRTTAPIDAWPQDLIADLHARHLLLLDGQGGVSLLPSLRSAIEADIPTERRQQLHQQAALLYAERSEHTLASFHLAQADEPALAVQAWFPHRQREIRRGQGDAALAILGEIDPEGLPPKVGKALRILRAELQQLLGAAQAGLAELQADTWPQDERLSLFAQQLEGDFLDALGETRPALDAYQRSAAVVAELLRNQTDLYVRRAMVHVRQRNVADAWREAQLARYATEQLHGKVQEMRGQLDDALLHYQSALALAGALAHDSGLAESHRCLSNVYGLRGELDQSLQHAQQAISIYERIGDQLSAARVRSNLAANLLDAGEYEDVLTVGTPALAFFQQVGHPHGIAATASNLAEAHLLLGNRTEAQTLAELSLQQEEPQAVPYALYTLALIALAEANPSQATKLLEDCCANAERNGDKFIEAHGLLKLAELHTEAGRSTDAARAAERAALFFEQLGIDDMAAQARQLSRAA